MEHFSSCLLVKLCSEPAKVTIKGEFIFYFYISEGCGNSPPLPQILYKAIVIFFQSINFGSGLIWQHWF